MQSDYIITFVLPCYNVEKYVQQCLNSILICSLSKDEYEIICIDDCSPDNTSAILHSYANKYSNIRVITHSENKGLGGARNTGIREARGKYIWFVDSDDFVECKELQGIIEIPSSEELDVLAFNYRDVDEFGNNGTDRIIFDKTEKQNGYYFVNSIFGDSFVNHSGYVWRYIYRTEYLRNNSLYFPEHVFWEDTVFAPKSILCAKAILSIPNVCYNYRRHSNSISGRFHINYSGDSIAQMCFGAGGDLLTFSYTIDNENLSKSFHNKAVSMINQFSLFLLRTNHGQRKKFFSEYKYYYNKDIQTVLTIKNKAFLIPFFGEFFLSCIRPLYIVKRTIKHFC